MNKKYIILLIANMAFAFARPLISAKLKSIDHIINSLTTDNEKTPQPDKLIVAAFIVAAAVAVGSLIGLAIAMRKIKVLTKKCKRAPIVDMEAQTNPPPEMDNVSCQAYFVGEDVGMQTYTPIFMDVSTQKIAKIEASDSGTFAERIGSVTRVLMDNWSGNSSTNLNQKPAPVTRSSYPTNREIIQHRARELEHAFMLANRKRFSPPTYAVLEKRAETIRAEIDSQRTLQFKKSLAQTGCPEVTLDLMKSESWFEFEVSPAIIHHVRSHGFMDDSDSE